MSAWFLFARVREIPPVFVLSTYTYTVYTYIIHFIIMIFCILCTYISATAAGHIIHAYANSNCIRPARRRRVCITQTNFFLRFYAAAERCAINIIIYCTIQSGRARRIICYAYAQGAVKNRRAR